MATIRIEVPDQQAAELQARAAAEGLSIEEWFRRLAEQEIRVSPPPRPGFRERVAELRELRKHIGPDPEGWTSRDYVRFGRR